MLRIVKIITNSMPSFYTIINAIAILAASLFFGLFGCNSQNEKSQALSPFALNLKRLPSEDSNTIRWVEELRNISNDTVYVSLDPKIQRDSFIIAEWRNVGGHLKLEYGDWDFEGISNMEITGQSCGGGWRKLKPQGKISKESSCNVFLAGVYQIESSWAFGFSYNKNDPTVDAELSAVLDVNVKPGDSIGYIGLIDALKIAKREIVKSGRITKDYKFLFEVPITDCSWEIECQPLRKGIPEGILVIIDTRTGETRITGVKNKPKGEEKENKAAPQ